LCSERRLTRPERCSSLPVAVLLLISVVLAGAGCAGYSESVSSARRALADGRPEEALDVLNGLLEVSSAREVPSGRVENGALYLAERGTVLQALGRYEQAARDMMAADQHLEYLDLANAGSLELGRYVYSERARPYRAPAYERLMLNVLNMINFLSIGDDEAARVEARRFALIESFFVEDRDRIVLERLRALGNYLSGVAFERGGSLRESARSYGRAYYFGLRTGRLADRVVDLYRVVGYEPGELRERDPQALRSLTEEAAKRSGLSRSAYVDRYLRGGDTLLIVQTGMVPHREPDGVSVSAAIRTARKRDRLTPERLRQFRRWSGKIGLTAVSVPELVQGEVPVTRPVHLRIGSRETNPVSFSAGVSIAGQVRAFWDEHRGTVMVAAITRLITRLLAAAATGRTVEQETGSKDLGWLSGVSTYLVLRALDQPDTRSWQTLPGEIRLMRTRIKPGEQSISVRVGARSTKRTVRIGERRLNVLNFSRYR